MKLKTILVAAVMILGLSAAAFAQATFQVGSIPVTTVTSTGQTERTGDITFTHLSGTSNAGTITISYGVPITVPLAGPYVSVTGTAGYATVAINASSNYAAGQLIIDVPGGAVAGTIVVSGVRVAVAGTALTSLQASLSTVGNAIVANQTTVTVISSITAGLASVSSTPGSINGVTGAITAQPTANAKEGYLNAFMPQDALIGDTTSVLVRFTLDKNPQAGVTVTFPLTASSGTGSTWTLCDNTGAVATGAQTISSTSTLLAAYYRITTPPTGYVTLQETLSVPVTLAVTATTFPLAASTVNFTASLAPVGTAFNSTGGTITTPIPRFAAAEVGPTILYTVIGSQTTLLIPYASTVTAGGYNAGFSIANTTSDPGTVIMGGITTAVKQSGTATFYMYPQLPAGGTAVPAMFSYTTKAGSPGTGLDASGNIPAGSTYTVLLSQLLAAAGAPADFQGYIFVVTNFTNAHCLYVLSNFAGFTQGALALVVPTPGGRNVAFEALNN
jgi:hypothetical protein